MHDGLIRADPYGTYITKYYNRQSIPTPVTITITVDETSPNQYDLIVETCLEAGADPMDLRIYTIGVEDHWPPLHPYDRNGFRQATAPVDIYLEAGECNQVAKTMTIVPNTVQENIKFLAWAQAPLSVGPAEVHQAAIIGYPFSPPCPWDCAEPYDGVVGVTDFLSLLASWGGGGPCDTDGDGAGITDFLSMLAHWGDCP
ncbi:MAG: hypothetical protein ACYSU7_08330 [Planctomycetota bacterium]